MPRFAYTSLHVERPGWIEVTLEPVDDVGCDPSYMLRLSEFRDEVELVIIGGKNIAATIRHEDSK